MRVSRRSFFRHSALSATAAAIAAAIPESLLALEPPRHPKAKGKTGDPAPVLLNSNENPYGAFPSVLNAMILSLNVANRYPDYEFDALWDGLGKLHNAKTEEIALGAGSTDLLRMAAEAFCTSKKRIVTAAPTFEALAMYAQRRNVEVTTVPLRTGDHAHDLDGMLRAAKDSGAGLVYICNPNNPTGTITPRAEIEQFIAKMPSETYLLIDEAYHHFVDSQFYQSFADKRSDNPRVFVLRTFSKIFGMAGLRVGYAVGTKETIDQLSKNYVFDSPNCVGARAASAGLKDTTALAAMESRMKGDRERFMAEAQKRKLTTLPSQANFVMMDTGKPIRTVIDYFKTKNVMIGRPFPPYDTYARISLGTPGEMQKFWMVWDGMS